MFAVALTTCTRCSYFKAQPREWPSTSSKVPTGGRYDTCSKTQRLLSPREVLGDRFVDPPLPGAVTHVAGYLYVFQQASVAVDDGVAVIATPRYPGRWHLVSGLMGTYHGRKLTLVRVCSTHSHWTAEERRRALAELAR